MVLTLKQDLAWLSDTGPLFTKWMDVLLQDPMKPWRHEIQVKTLPIALKFDRHLGSNAAELPVKFQSDTIIITSNLAASRLPEIWCLDVHTLSD